KFKYLDKKDYASLIKSRYNVEMTTTKTSQEFKLTGQDGDVQQAYTLLQDALTDLKVVNETFDPQYKVKQAHISELAKYLQDHFKVILQVPKDKGTITVVGSSSSLDWLAINNQLQSLKSKPVVWKPSNIQNAKKVFSEKRDIVKDIKKQFAL